MNDLASLAPERIALIKPSALGDIMHSLPVLTALRERYPRAHITWVVNRIYEPLLVGHADLDATLAFDRHPLRKGWIRGAWGFIKFLRTLRRSHFDLVIDLQGLLRTGIMSRATGARVRLGLGSAREGARAFYTHVIDDDPLDQTHAVDRYWRVVEALGWSGDKRFRLAVEPAAREWAEQALADCPRPWIGVGVGARWRTKRWPPEHFAALAQRALDRYGGTAMLVGAPDEVELASQAAQLISGPVRDLTGATTLPQLAAVLGDVDVLLANDTGPLHLAVALGRPVVAPYTCTVARRTGPYGQHERAVETGVWCAGSFLRRCERMECMAELTPDRLWPALEQVLITWERQLQSA